MKELYKLIVQYAYTQDECQYVYDVRIPYILTIINMDYYDRISKMIRDTSKSTKCTTLYTFDKSFNYADQLSCPIEDNINDLFFEFCTIGYRRGIKMLINYVDLCENDYVSFRILCSNGNLKMIKYLLKHKPDINICAKDHHGFRLATMNNHHYVYNFLKKYHTERSEACERVERGK